MNNRIYSLILGCCILLCAGFASQAMAAPANPGATPTAAVQASTGAPAAALASRHFDADAATKEWLAQIPPDARAKSDAYYEGGYWLLVWDFLVGLLVAWLMLGTKLSARVRDRLEKVTRFRWLQT